ncbi:hypothetical protein Poli38472_009871 [Pythium oligandrum]|uniref:VPS9 domain-containing protein n=1 Tax=Pythium oligandrum TaxID=41045 RepID=A0A8K1CH32_PYTOL|nr:hypothetical protein Poli38472_009871 [Pythium oligandrum]|eukprot:TMW62378.1 hypothetical protein Poli38472_009871 [Pythium oligandrum]
MRVKNGSRIYAWRSHHPPSHCAICEARTAMGIASDNTMDKSRRDSVEELDDSELLALDVSAATVERLLSEDGCLVDQLDECGRDQVEDEDDHGSLISTFVGDEDDELLSGPECAPVEAGEPEPSVFTKRSDSVRSSFSLRETMVSEAPCSCAAFTSTPKLKRASSIADEYVDPEIRRGIIIRVVGIESAEMNSRYIIRVEDIETAKNWELRKNTKEMAQFYYQIRQICMENAPVKKELWGTFRCLRKLRLPKKFFHSRGALCYQRKVVYDSLLRHAAALASPSPMGPRRRKVVSLLHEFVEVPLYCQRTNREVCNCWCLPVRVNATQLIAEVFADKNHPINQECRGFVSALTKKTHDNRRTKLYPRQANAILKTISRKLSDVKKSVLADVTLLQQVGTIRQEMPEAEFDDFVDEVRRAAAAFVQKAILVELEDHVYESLHVLYSDEEEKVLMPKVKHLQLKPQSFFGIPEHLESWNKWEEARAELREVAKCALPQDKLKCIVRAASAIFRLCNRETAVSASVTASATDPALSTDEFLQVYYYVVVMANIPQLLRTLQLLRLTCDEDDLGGEMGYYFTSFEAAVTLIEQHDN